MATAQKDHTFIGLEATKSSSHPPLPIQELHDTQRAPLVQGTQITKRAPQISHTHALPELEQQTHGNDAIVASLLTRVTELEGSKSLLEAEIRRLGDYVYDLWVEMRIRLDPFGPGGKVMNSLSNCLTYTARVINDPGFLHTYPDLNTQYPSRYDRQHGVVGLAAPTASSHQTAPGHSCTPQQPREVPTNEQAPPQYLAAGEPVLRNGPHYRANSHHPLKTHGDLCESKTEPHLVPGSRSRTSTDTTSSWRTHHAQSTERPAADQWEIAVAPAAESEDPNNRDIVTNHGKRPIGINDGPIQHGQATAGPKRRKLADTQPRVDDNDLVAPTPVAGVSHTLRTANDRFDRSHDFDPAPNESNNWNDLRPGAGSIGVVQQHISMEPNAINVARAQDCGQMRRSGDRKHSSRYTEEWRTDPPEQERLSGCGEEKLEKFVERNALYINQEEALPQFSSAHGGHIRQHTQPCSIVPRPAGYARGLLPAKGLFERDRDFTADGIRPPILQGRSKKPRTKPTRDSTGVLVRKDGLPDKRTVTSSKNLRKMHIARKADRNGDPPSHQANSMSSEQSSDCQDDQNSAIGSSATGIPTTTMNEKRDKRDLLVQGHSHLVNMDGKERDLQERSDTPKAAVSCVARLDGNTSGHGEAEQVETIGSTRIPDSITGG